MKPSLIYDKTLEKDFKQTIAYLTLNASFVTNLGLFHGKMGYVLFFAHYGRAMKNVLYEDLAGELLDEIFEELDEDWALSLENGLCGIGWGIEYLIQHDFMEGCTDEILKNIDSRIMEWDPRRIKNLSLRKGLGGIVCYVAIRLSSPRGTAENPFDSIYLQALVEAISQNDFSGERDLPENLLHDFIHCIEGDKTAMNPLFDDLLNTVWESCLHFGIEPEIDPLFPVEMDNPSPKEKRLYLIKDENPSANYGVGTYITQICEVMRRSKWNVVVVTLRSTKTSTLTIEKKENILYVEVGNIRKVSVHLGWKKYNKRYYRNVLVLWQACFQINAETSVFHLNNMHMADLAIGLKSVYSLSKVIGTVHYMDWSLTLLGDKAKLQEMFNHPQEEKSQSILTGLEENKRLLHACDKVIAISRHSYRIITKIAGISPSKVEVIPHGIKDAYHPISGEEKNRLRQKYGFSPEDRILIYAGRIDTLKGTDSLAVAFESLSVRYPNLRLILAGEGMFRLIHEKIKYTASKITFTGWVDKTTLYALYAIADMGIVPSLYEESGYVALEMMMMKLPVIAGNNTGLKESIGNGMNGLLVPLQSSYGKVRENALLLEEAIERLLLSLSLQKDMGKNGRKRYLANYHMDSFYRLYSRILNKNEV